MIGILLVGGLGTRLRPLTLHRPKALLPILNTPFLSFQLDLLKKSGVKNIVLAAGYKSRGWEDELRAITPKGVRLCFAYEKKLLGTGGAIRLSYEEGIRTFGKTEGPVVVFNGDVLFDIDLKSFLRFHRAKKSECSLALIKVQDPSRFGVVKTRTDGRVTKFIEKPKGRLMPSQVNAGVYIFEPAIMATIPRNQVVSIERDIFPLLLKRKTPVFGYKTTGYWNDIGTPSTYLQAHHDLLQNKTNWTLTRFFRKSGQRSQHVFGSGTKVAKNVLLQGNVVCGKNVRIENDCEIRDSILMDHVLVGEGVRISKTIIGAGSILGHHSEIKEGAVLGDKSILTPHSKF